MKAAFLLLLCTLLLAIPVLLNAQSPTDGHMILLEHRAGFLDTFVKTPFAILTMGIAFLCSVFAGFFEGVAWLFTGFSYDFHNTKQIWQIGMNGVVGRWWWNPAVWWHLIICIPLSLSFFGAMWNNKRNN